MQLDSTNFEIKVLAVDFLQDVDAASMLLPYVNYNLFLTFNLSLSTYQHGTSAATIYRYIDTIQY